MLILIAGEKGGSWKSTIAVQLGIERTRKGVSTLVIDGDTQGTAHNWLSRRAASGHEPIVPCEEIRTGEFHVKMPNLVDQYEDIIIDIAGRDSAEMREALGFVDIAIFPVRPTMNDLETASRMDMLVGKYLKISEHLKRAVFVLSQASPNPFRSYTNRDAISYLSDCENIETLKSIICSRAAYERASIEGAAVTELTPAVRMAAKEFTNFYKEIFE